MGEQNRGILGSRARWINPAQPAHRAIQRRKSGRRHPTRDTDRNKPGQESRSAGLALQHGASYTARARAHRRRPREWPAKEHDIERILPDDRSGPAALLRHSAKTAARIGMTRVSSWLSTGAALAANSTPPASLSGRRFQRLDTQHSETGSRLRLAARHRGFCWLQQKPPLGSMNGIAFRR